MKTLHQIQGIACLAVMAIGTVFQAAQAADVFPDRPVRIIVPTPAGGPSDISTRLIAQSLTSAWNQQVIVENKAGAGGAIAAQAVMTATPDGYTLLWAQASMTGLSMVQKNSPFKSMNELTPISNVMQFSYALFVNKDLPVNSLADLVAYGKKNPKSLSYATGTLGEYMACAQVLKATGIDALRVPYKGGAQLMPDLMTGQVQMNCGPILSGLQHVKAGKLKMLATYTQSRSPLAQDVPTLTDLGYADINLPSWNALFAPVGTPREIVNKIADGVASAARAQEVRMKFEQLGAVSIGSGPAQLAEAVEGATGVWKNFVRDYDIPQE